jgi:hypothetical protein
MLRTERSQNLALIALGIVVFSLFALIISFSSSKDVPVTQEQHQASEKHASKNEKGYWRELWRKTSDDPIALFTFWLVILTAVMSLGAVTQFFFLLRSDKTTRISADATQSAASAALIRAESIKNIERPYLLIEKIIPRIRDVHEQGPPTVREFPDIDCTIKNYGRTPARIKMISTQLRLSRDTAPADILPISGITQLKTIGSNESYDLPFVPLGAPIDGKESLIKMGQICLWLHFRFVYLDMTGPSHETKGKWRYNFLSDAWEGDYETIS